jgi:hypothetical protein
MRETFVEKLGEKVYGIKWEMNFLKDEIRNADHYIRETNMTIEATKKQHPRDWQKRIKGWKADLAYYRGIKAGSTKGIKRLKMIKQAHKLGKVI